MESAFKDLKFGALASILRRSQRTIRLLVSTSASDTQSISTPPEAFASITRECPRARPRHVQDALLSASGGSLAHGLDRPAKAVSTYVVGQPAVIFGHRLVCDDRGACPRGADEKMPIFAPMSMTVQPVDTSPYSRARYTTPIVARSIASSVSIRVPSRST